MPTVDVALLSLELLELGGVVVEAKAFGLVVVV